MAKILVVGGAGYIGSRMVKQLVERGDQVVVLDDLSSGHLDAVWPGAEFIHGHLADVDLLGRLFLNNTFDAVMHFAAHIEVGESVVNPHKYYENNVCATLRLLEIMRAHDVQRFIFSSTVAIFGEPQYTPIDEQHPKQPLNPYGRSKWMIEQILQDFDIAYGLKSICLRYFNASGAESVGRLGERHDPETHLIPLILQAAAGTRADIKIFGQDYATADGTCIRDYIHVVDLCDAHALALDQLLAGGDSDRFNLGNGNGFSVREVIEMAKTVTARPIKVVEAPRRTGDPAVLIADATRAQQVLGWQPQFTIYRPSSHMLGSSCRVT